MTYTADIVGRMAPGTGLPASIAALMLQAGEVTVKGVVAPGGLHRSGKISCGINPKRRKNSPDREDRIDASNDKPDQEPVGAAAEIESPVGYLEGSVERRIFVKPLKS